jgi:hypothetical protein
MPCRKRANERTACGGSDDDADIDPTPLPLLMMMMVMLQADPERDVGAYRPADVGAVSADD